MINRFGALLVNRNVVICYIGAKAADPLFHPTLLKFVAHQNMHLALAICKLEANFRKRCSYASERPQMALKVPESAEVVYSIDNLMVFEPSRAPLEPSGGEPDHFKLLKPDQNGRRGGQITLLDGKKTKSDGTKGHFTCI